MRMRLKNKNGFTLIELLMAMTTGIIVLAGIYTAFNSQQKIHTKESQVVDAEQSVRGAAYFMVREIRLAGMDVTGMAGAGFVTAGPHSIRFTLDFQGGVPRGGDGVLDADEDITYGFSTLTDDTDADGLADSGAAPIYRITAANSRLAEDIHAIGFAYAFDDDGDGELDYVDVDGDSELDAGEEIWAYDSDADGDLDRNNAGGALASDVNYNKIRAVRIWVLARTRQPLSGYSGPKNFIVGDKPVNRNDNFKYLLLTHTVKCRNMGI